MTRRSVGPAPTRLGEQAGVVDPDTLRFPLEMLVLITAGERLAYAQRPEEGTLVVLDTARGRMVNPYDVDLDGPLAVPELFSADAATSVHVEGVRYLVTTVLDEGYGLRG